MQPLTDRRGLVDLRQAQEHLRLIFGERDWKENEFICVRGIGEKGTEQEGVFREDIFVEPAKEGFAPVLSATERWAQYNVATFVVPGILSDRRATSANVARMRSLVADLDAGDTDAKMRELTEQLGEPSLVVCSGGTTDEGTPKRHVWYALDDEVPV